MMTNDISKLTNGAAKYTAMCYENGGTVDDLLVYKFQDEDYLLVVNASNIEKDYKWLEEHLEGDVQLENISEGVAQLALQGPSAEKILSKWVRQCIKGSRILSISKRGKLGRKKSLDFTNWVHG